MPGTLLLDSEGFSKPHRKDRTVVALVQAASEEGVRVATSAMTTLEADHERIHPARIKWVLSRVDVHDVTEEITDEAAALLRAPHLHGHKDAIDAAIARSTSQPITVLTSRPRGPDAPVRPFRRGRQGLKTPATAPPTGSAVGHSTS